ncbi:MAG TPA: AAA family ATPase [Candidatus Paceibacterota bacterium]|nr:AAA family ATPase [Candidatus Paceibacterota bacterium]
MKEITRAALEWAADGVPVFPCGSDKRPLTTNGFYDAVTDETSVKQLFELAPDDCLIGARMGEHSGLFACDFDIYKSGTAGKSAQQYMAQLIADGLLPDSQRHRTMNGGLHVIFQSQFGFPNCKPVEGVEIKGEGGYIILPPSKGYQIEADVGFAQAPKALIDALVKARKTFSARSVEYHEQNIIAAKDFHDSIASIAAKLFASGAKAAAVSERIFAALNASVARAVEHDRHQRWAALVSDRDGELSRIINSGRAKYDTSAKTDRARDNFSDETTERAQRTAADAGFAPSPNMGEDPEPSPEDYGEAWPFAGEGYFAGQTLEVADQDFNLYPIYATNESVVIAADPKSGKTAISLKLALQVAMGRSFGGFQTDTPRGVLYYALEGTRAVKLRLEAEKRHAAEHDTPIPDNIPLFVIERPTNFMSAQAENVAKVVAADRYVTRHTDRALGLIVIDTLTKAMPGADQNSVDETSQLFEFTTKLRAQGITATIVFIHHTGKDGKTRGSSNIEAEVDVVLKMRKLQDGLTEMRIHMARSIDDDSRYIFKLESYDLGKTSQGFKQSAPIVLMADDPVNQSTSEAVIDAQFRAKHFSAILGLGDGTHEVERVLTAFKHSKLINARRVRMAVVTDILDKLFATGREQRFGGKTIAATKVDAGYTQIRVSD